MYNSPSKQIIQNVDRPPYTLRISSLEMQNRIREIRKLRGWTLEQLAEKVGNTSADQISKLERGDRGLDVNWMNRIGKALDVEPAELLPTNKVSEKTVSEYKGYESLPATRSKKSGIVHFKA